jgi:hypothetical protein
MTVLSTFVGQLKPGRLEDAIAMTRQAAKSLERTGAKSVRLVRVATGEAYGALAVTVEYESNEAYGKGLDAIVVDDEIVTQLARIDSADSPYTSQTVSTSLEIPMGGPTGRGAVLQVIVSRAAPGRMQEAIDLGKRTAELVGRYGANGCRLFWLQSAGSQAGLLAIVFEYASNAAMGKSGDSFLSDPDGLALLRDVYGAGSPITIISTDVYNEIPL